MRKAGSLRHLFGFIEMLSHAVYKMRLVTLELSYLLGTGTVSKSGSVRVRTCVDSEGFWPAQFCVQFRADCHDNHTGGLKRLWEDNIIEQLIQERR
jgi:hypothetical protein